MGLNHTGTKLLLYAKSLGVDFSKTAMLGRQSLHIDKYTLRENLAYYGYHKVDTEQLLLEKSGYAEPFLQLLGAKQIDSIDASGYETATIIHDMNLPISNKFSESYDTVIDGGSLEHIFNFPVAIKNCMSMVKLNGHFVGISPTNNFMGHGFYQFSPELYFRVFSLENGFKIEKMLFFVDKRDTHWYEVSDPNEVRQRVILCNSYPSYLCVIARRTSRETIFGTIPQQSDYQNLLWKEEKSASLGKPGAETSMGAKITSRISDKLSELSARLSVLFNESGTARKDFFKRIK